MSGARRPTSSISPSGTSSLVAGIGLTLAASAACAAPAIGGDLPADCAGPDLASVVVVEDQLAPGVGRPYQRFDRANVARTPSGEVLVAFTADLAGDVLTDDVAYVGETLMHQEGEDVPGTGGTVADILTFDGQRSVNGSGVLAARLRLNGVPAGTDLVVVADGQVLARSGDLVPDGTGDRYTSFDFVGIADDGRVGFHARTDGDSSIDSVIVQSGTVLYRKGDPSPFDDGAAWDGRFDEVAWNARGDVIFEGNLAGPSATDRVIAHRYVASDGTVHEVVRAREGDAMGEAGAASLDVIEQLVLSAEGHWAARVLLEDASGGTNEAVIDAAGLVVREGDAVDGIPGAFVGPIFAVSVDSAGFVVAAADLTGTPPPGVEQAILRGRCAVAAAGTQPTGLPEGTWLSTIGFEDLVAGPAGELTFSASYGGRASGDGIFRVDDGLSCPPDVSGDGIVGALDLVMLLQAWGACPGTVCPADLDGNGVVDFADVLELMARWGSCT